MRALVIAAMMASSAKADPPRIRMASMRACYEVLLRRIPEMSGKVVLQLDVSAEGRVTRAEVATETLRDSWFLRCVRESAMSWRLSQNEGVRLSYAVVFQPGQ